MTARGAVRCSSSPRLSRAIARGRRYVSVLPLLDRTSTNIRAECCGFSITESRIRVAWMPSDFPPNQRCFGKNSGKCTVSSRRRPPPLKIPSQPSAMLKGALSLISTEISACQPPSVAAIGEQQAPEEGVSCPTKKAFHEWVEELQSNRRNCPGHCLHTWQHRCSRPPSRRLRKGSQRGSCVAARV